jgi:hypothetical protein
VAILDEAHYTSNKIHPVVWNFTDSSSMVIAEAVPQTVSPHMMPLARQMRPKIKLEQDHSSVYPLYEPRNETYDEKPRASEEELLSELLTQDFIVKMPPVKRFSFKIKLRTVRKKTPNPIEP